MSVFENVGKVLLVIGVIIALSGLVLIYAPKIPFLGKLPGDIMIKKKNFTFYFPLATSLLLSLLISFILWIIGRR